jgi:regulator of sigma E protease
MQQAPQPWEFRSKPAWQRLIIMIGGVVMNVVLAYFIYTGLLISRGEQYVSTAEVNRYGIVTNSLANELGFQDGDKILSVGGNYIEEFANIQKAMLLEDNRDVVVERDGVKKTIEIDEEALGKLAQAQELIMTYRFPFVIKDFSPGSPAKEAGMKIGDRIIAINGVATPYFQDFSKQIVNFADSDVNFDVVRNGDTLQMAMHLPQEAKIGVYTETINLSTVEYSFFEAIPKGFNKTGKELSDYWNSLKLLFQPETKAYKSLGGFITIGNIFPNQFNWFAFWNLTAFLSIILAVMNILPIPALDGGHVLFLLVEIITRRKPSDKFLEIAQTIGLVILFALLIVANGNDIIRWLF